MKKAAKKAPAKVKAKRSPEPDVNQLAHHLIKATTTEDSQPVFFPPTQADISRVMAELGRRGGKIGGKARATAMTPERRREVALKAARSRWDRKTH
jgi:hypothetical protein